MKDLSKILILVLGTLFLLAGCNDGGSGGSGTVSGTDVSPQVNMSFGDSSGGSVDTTLFEAPTVVHNPEPTTLLLLGSGLIGLAGYGRKKFFKK